MMDRVRRNSDCAADNCVAGGGVRRPPGSQFRIGGRASGDFASNYSSMKTPIRLIVADDHALFRGRPTERPEHIPIGRKRKEILLGLELRFKLRAGRSDRFITPVPCEALAALSGRLRPFRRTSPAVAVSDNPMEPETNLQASSSL
jgi:hypothetical protein